MRELQGPLPDYRAMWREKMWKRLWRYQDLPAMPDNLTLVPMPPYSPELNPVERLWLYLRERYLSHCLLQDYNAVVDAWLATPGPPSRRSPDASSPSPAIPGCHA